MEYVGGRMMTVDDFTQLRSDCRYALVSLNSDLSDYGFNSNTFQAMPPSIRVPLYVESGYHSMIITCPVGIPGNRGTEADGLPSAFKGSLINMDNSIFAVHTFESVNELIGTLMYFGRTEGQTENLHTEVAD